MRLFVGVICTLRMPMRRRPRPIFMNVCSRFWKHIATHVMANGERKGGHAFDEFKSDKELVGDTKLWLAVLKNVRAGYHAAAGRGAADEGGAAAAL